MSRPLKWTLVLVGGAALAGLLIFAFIQGRREIAQEREREQPIKIPPRIARDTNGNLVVTLSRETQSQIGLKTQPAAAETQKPSRHWASCRNSGPRL